MEAALRLRDEAMRAFISALAPLEPTAPTWCAGWSVHELTAHVTAAAEERAALIDDHLAGKPARATRSWEEREPPFRAMHDAELREQLVKQAVRFESSVAALKEDDTILYTGWEMTAERLLMHSHSEAVLHRWDLVGDDDISIRLLSDPAMVTHALAVFDAMPTLAEARRWRESGMVVTPTEGLLPARDGNGVAVGLRPHEPPLLLWGRCPSRLRDPHANAETIQDIMQRLCREGGASAEYRGQSGRRS
jgi:uncharacterized protein (TIGR03083 family)